MSEYDYCLITFLTGHNGSTETFINATATQKGLNSDQFNWTSEKIRPPHTADLTLIHQKRILLLLIWHRVALKHSADKTDLRILHSVYNSCLLGINQQLLGNFLIVWSWQWGNITLMLVSQPLCCLIGQNLKGPSFIKAHEEGQVGGLAIIYQFNKRLYLCGMVFSDKNSSSCLTGYIQYQASYCERVWVVFSRFH